MVPHSPLLPVFLHPDSPLWIAILNHPIEESCEFGVAACSSCDQSVNVVEITGTASARRIAIALASLTLGLGAAGCGGGGSQANPSQTTSAGPTGSSSSAPASTGPHSSASAGHSTAVTHGGTGSDRCHVADLKADIQVQKDGSAMAVLTHKGSRTCTVNGYLNYRGLLADNSAVVVMTKHVAHPGAPVLVTLKPGTSAFSGLKWASCDKADASCRVLAGVQVTPPGDTAHLTATVIGTDGKAQQQLTVSSAGFTAGSLQPASQGVVFL